jgi:hypothetical protein
MLRQRKVRVGSGVIGIQLNGFLIRLGTSWVATRSSLPDLRTLPSRILLTFSFRAMVGMSSFLPLNENDEVRAMTRNAGTLVSSSMSSSARPLSGAARDTGIPVAC